MLAGCDSSRVGRMRGRTQPVVMSLRSSPTGVPTGTNPPCSEFFLSTLNSQLPPSPPEVMSAFTLNPSLLHALFTLVLILLFVCLFRLKPEN